MARPLTLLKAVSGFLAALLALGISLGLGICSLRDRRWAALEARVAELTPDLATPALPRVPLGRTLVPGNAWDDYFRIRSGSIPKHLPDNLEELLADGSPEDRKALIDRNAVPLGLLRSAVRRETAKLPPSPKPPGKNDIVGYTDLPIPRLASLCVAQARLAAESGNVREALDLLLDVCLFGRDFAGTRLMQVSRWGLQPMETALREIEELSRKLDPELLRELERQLALLDEYFPDTSGEMLDQLLHLGELFVQEDEGDEVYLHFDPDRVRRHWRYFYSPRLEAASSFARADGILREALAQKDRSWTAAEPVLWDLENRLEALKDPVLDYFLKLRLDTFHARNTQTYLRMVRMAVHYRATGAVLAIENAQGGPIGTQRVEETLLIWNERPPEPQGVESPADRTSVGSFRIEVPIRK